MTGEDPVTTSAEIDAANHYLIFIFDLTGLYKPAGEASNSLTVYPNPFMDYTVLTIGLEENSEVLIKIADQQGRCVNALFKGMLDKGVHRFEWNGNDVNGHPVPSGLYSISLQTRSGIQSIKVIKN
jgi:hypothetical protein